MRDRSGQVKPSGLLAQESLFIISGYQLWLFFMANWILICAGSTNVASVILQAQVPYRCFTKIDEVYVIKFNDTLSYEEGVLFMPGDEHENPSKGIKNLSHVAYVTLFHTL